MSHFLSRIFRTILRVLEEGRHSVRSRLGAALEERASMACRLLLLSCFSFCVVLMLNNQSEEVGVL